MTAPHLAEPGYQPLPRPKRNPLTRITASHLLMVLAAVLAFATNVMVLRNQEETRSIVVAATSIEAGRSLTASEDFRVAEVDLDDDLFASLIPWEQATGLSGKVAARAIGAGEMVICRQTSARRLLPTACVRYRFRLIPSTQSVVSSSSGTASTSSPCLSEVGSYVLSNAEVLAVPSQEPGPRSPVPVGITWSLRSTPSRRSRLPQQFARREIDVVRSTGSTDGRAGS